jgi:serine/threonine-protein kinase RsbW
MSMTASISSDRSGLSITLPAKAESIAIARHAAAGLGEQIGMDEPAIGDLKTVVTEACANVVSHAHDSVPGPFQVEVLPRPGGLTVWVRDFGGGMRPRRDVERPNLRLGLALIAGLSSSFEIRDDPDGGTEIRMRLSLS